MNVNANVVIVDEDDVNFEGTHGHLIDFPIHLGPRVGVPAFNIFPVLISMTNVQDAMMSIEV